MPHTEGQLLKEKKKKKFLNEECDSWLKALIAPQPTNWNCVHGYVFTDDKNSAKDL